MIGPNQEKNLADESIKTEGPVQQVRLVDSASRTISQVSMAVSFFALGLAIGGIVIVQMLYTQSKQDKAEVLSQARADKTEIVAQSKAEKIDREQAYNNRAQVSENHWRNVEVQLAVDEAEIKRLREELRNANRR